jgi:drug/metabolite transporter (DMT)-like permease
MTDRAEQKGRRDARRGFLGGATEDKPTLAAGLVLVAVFLLALQDGLIKLVNPEVSLWQFQALRSTLNLILLFLLSRVIWGTTPPRPKRPLVVALRSMLLVGAMFLFFGGVPFLTLAEIAAGLYVFPLFASILAAVVLRERLGPRRILAIGAGFAGTLLILKPGTESFTLVGLMPVGAGLCYAGQILVTRKLCREESPVTLALGVAITFLIFGVGGLVFFTWAEGGALAVEWPYLFTGWHEPALWVLGIVATSSVLNLTANIGLAKAYQSAEASWLASFDYTYMIFATFWGFVFWGDIPDSLTFAGMAMIASAGVFVTWRERLAEHSGTQNQV